MLQTEKVFPELELAIKVIVKSFVDKTTAESLKSIQVNYSELLLQVTINIECRYL